MIITQNPPPLGLAHFTVLEVPPLELVSLAARIGYASVGLRLHPAFPGAPYYTIPTGSSAMREMKERMQGEGSERLRHRVRDHRPGLRGRAAEGHARIRRRAGSQEAERLRG